MDRAVGRRTVRRHARRGNWWGRCGWGAGELAGRLQRKAGLRPGCILAGIRFPDKAGSGEPETAPEREYCA